MGRGWPGWVVSRPVGKKDKIKKPASKPSPPTITRPGAFILRSGHPLSLMIPPAYADKREGDFKPVFHEKVIFFDVR